MSEKEKSEFDLDENEIRVQDNEEQVNGTDKWSGRGQQRQKNNIKRES